jgi:hypothetical protein
MDYPRLSRRWVRPVGFGLIVLSALLYGLILLLPLLPFPARVRLAAVPVLVILGEIAFWGGGALLGAAVVARYRRWLDPRRWFKRDEAES